jgi:NADPH-dependent glutamate synthase beta subunit-like oxidoreductase
LSLVAMSGPSRLKFRAANWRTMGWNFFAILDPAKNAVSGGTAAIVGGGNTAIDVARSLVRRGVSPLIVYRRRLEDMPAFEPEIGHGRKGRGQNYGACRPHPHSEKHVGDASISHPAYRLTLQQMKVGKEKIAGRASCRAGW